MPSPVRSAPARWLLLALAILCVALGIVGLFLPVLPTVPFLLVAAWAAARSSPSLDDWLHNHPHFGEQLRAWRDNGAVPRRAKWLATIMMSISAAGLLVMMPGWPAQVVAGCMAGVLVWLWRRPE